MKASKGGDCPAPVEGNPEAPDPKLGPEKGGKEPKGPLGGP